MPKLAPFPEQVGRDFHHPALRYIDEERPDRVEMEIVRPKDAIGFKPAKIRLFFTKDGVATGLTEYLWDDELNYALVQRGCKSVSEENEKVRFALDLRYRLKHTESRFGDGFFNSVLIIVVRDGGFDQFPDVQKVIPHIQTSPPFTGGSSLQDCRETITEVFGQINLDLRQRLQYSAEDAETILVGAVARYLDERFTVTDRIRLGWA